MRHYYIRIILCMLLGIGFSTSLLRVGNAASADPGRSIEQLIAQQRIIIGRVEWRVTGPGSINEHLQRAFHKIPLAAGQPLEIPVYERTKASLLQRAVEQGYLNAQWIQHTIQLQARDRTARILLELETGPRYYVGPIRFETRYFDLQFVKRYASFKENDVYYPGLVDALQDALQSSGYFSSVEIVTPMITPGNTAVPIDVKLVPQSAHTYTFSLGYGTDTGSRARLGWEARYLNPSGHRALAQLKVSSRRFNRLEAQYLIPGVNPLKDVYSINALAQQLNTRFGESTLLGIGASYQTYIRKWQQTFGLNIQKERSELDGQALSESIFALPFIGWTYRKTDQTLNPQHGYSFNVQFRGALKNALAPLNFLQAKLDYKFLHTFANRDRVLTRASWGYTITDDLGDLPLSLNFLTGGSQSVRGFSFQSIGPGRYLAVGSVEYQKYIKNDWYGAVFYDTGTTSNRFNREWERSTGIGVSKQTTIGSFQVYLARPLSRERNSLRIVFNIGADL